MTLSASCILSCSSLHIFRQGQSKKVEAGESVQSQGKMMEEVKTKPEVNENDVGNEDKTRIPIKYSRSHSTKRAISFININEESESKSYTNRKPCILRQKSAPSRYGSRRYLPKQRSTTSTSAEYHLDVAPELSYTSDTWTVPPSRPRLKLDLTSKQQNNQAKTKPSFHTIFSIIVSGIFLVAIVGLIIFLNLA